MALFDRRNRAKSQREMDARRRESERIAQEIRNQFYSSPLCSDYENLFAQVRPLINDMKLVRPYGVGANGARLPKSRTQALNILDYPNEDMGWAEFADLMFATWLTKDQLYIHVWKQGKTVKGYTVLPSSSRSWVGNQYQWQVKTADGRIETLTADDVMTLRFSRSPDDPDKGVSPATAIRVWTQVDDVIGQYQRSYFENGAIPATLTFITASTQEKYDAVRHELERKTRGAENANKTVYIWRQMLPDTGETKDQVEVKTIQAPNSTLAIKDIVSIVNDKLNKSIGVSNFILGDDSSAKYDNAELSDYQFIKRRVYPALISFWSQFQHELDRITGGLGYAIQFDLEIPDLTERAKTRAETARTNAETFTKLIQAGADPEAVTKALGLDADWYKAGVGIQVARDADKALQKLQVIQGINAARATEAKHDCCHHEHHTDAHAEFGPEEKTEERIYNHLISIARAIVDENPNFDFDLVKDEIFELLEQQAQQGGIVALENIADLLEDADIEEAIRNAIEKGYDISDALTDRLRERTNLLVTDYERQTREQVRAALIHSEPLTAEETKKRLEMAIPDGRAATIARNETVYAFKSGRLDADEDMAKRWNIQLELEWRCSKDSETCPTCFAMDGTRTRIGQPFPAEAVLPAGTILPDGTVLDKATPYAVDPDVWNDQGLIPSAHVNCRCYFNEHVIRTA